MDRMQSLLPHNPNIGGLYPASDVPGALAAPRFSGLPSGQEQMSPSSGLAALVGSSGSPSSSQKRRASRSTMTYPRKRAIKACLTCRFRRTKCDNARPACAACARLGADCAYQESDHSSFDPASLAILQRLDSLESLLVQSRAADRLVALGATTSPSASRSDLDSSATTFHTRGKSLVSIEAVLQWPPFVDCPFPSCLYPVSRDEDKPRSSTVSADVDLPGAEAVFRTFFNNVHIFNPILEEEEVQGYLKRVRFEGIGWDAVSCLVLLIYAHGSIITPFVEHTTGHSELPANFRRSAAFLRAESYFLAAQKRMGMLLCGSGVIEAQCFFLAGAYLMTTLRPVEAWKIFVQALACCQGFRINQRYAEESQVEDGSDPKQRIYWTCFKSELELRLELNPSQKDVWDLTYPTFFPSPPESVKTKEELAWYFYLAEIALMRLKSRILSNLYHSDASRAHESSMEDAVLDFEEQIEAWVRSLPEQLQLDVTDSPQEDHQALRFILRGHLIDCREVMYWPFVADAIHGKLRHGRRAEEFLRAGLQVCLDRILQNRKGFYHRHHGTWLMIRSCSRSSFVMLAAVQCPDLAPYVPMDWKDAVMDVAEMLRLWKDESTDVYEMLDILESLLSKHDAGS